MDKARAVWRHCHVVLWRHRGGLQSLASNILALCHIITNIKQKSIVWYKLNSFFWNKMNNYCKRHVNGTYIRNFKFLWQNLWPTKLVQINEQTDRSMRTGGPVVATSTSAAIFTLDLEWSNYNKNNNSFYFGHAFWKKKNTNFKNI